jgi:hypothetical protein
MNPESPLEDTEFELFLWWGTIGITFAILIGAIFAAG